jgi:hypothetical protein
MPCPGALKSRSASSWLNRCERLELAIAGIAQDGSDLELLHQDFERAAVPLEVFLRGLEAEPALQRSA